MLKRCGEWAAAAPVYDIAAAITHAEIKPGGGGVTVVLTDVRVALLSTQCTTSGVDGCASAKFGDLDWNGKASADAALKITGADDSIMAAVKLTAKLDFSVVGGSPVFGSLGIDGEFHYSDDALELSGTVKVAVPCQAGGLLITSIRLTLNLLLLLRASV